jgi:uncharacterized protein (DUF1684 family)
MTRFIVLVGAALMAWCECAVAIDAAAERNTVEQWRAQRVAELTGDDGWLTLVGLLWLEKGENTFGRSRTNRLVLNHPAVPEVAGTFVQDSSGIRFSARPGSAITRGGQPVSTIDMVPDSRGNPTTLSKGTLRFFIIERSGRFAVRVRDLDSPRRRNFTPIEYYPVDPGWAIDARFEPYQPHHKIRISTVLGYEQEMDSPGALIFNIDGREWRLDALLQDPADKTFFVMFADGTNGSGSYGGGRFLHVPFPQQGLSRVDFNQAYNPPCAFNDFATCPLPPYQNHIALRIEAGEKAYAGH